MQLPLESDNVQSSLQDSGEHVWLDSYQTPPDSVRFDRIPAILVRSSRLLTMAEFRPVSAGI